MGLFDTFIVPKAKCPNCGHVYDADFQSKVFDPLLNTYKIGDAVETPTMRAKDIDFEMHDTCPSCDKYFETWGTIKDSKFVGLAGQGAAVANEESK